VTTRPSSIFRAFIAFLARLLSPLVGRVSWTAPPWLAWCGRRLAALCRRPRVAALVLLVLAGLGLGSWQAWHWWQTHRARTFTHNVGREVQVTVSAPEPVVPGAQDKDLKPAPLIVRFAGAPVAPPDKIDHDAADAITSDPPLAGKWTWRDSTTLVFQPAQHWPADSTIHLQLRPAALPGELNFDHTKLTVKTAPLVAQVRDFSFYNSPVDPAVYQVVGELLLSHPVALDMLQQRLKMEVVGGTRLFAEAGSAPLFSVNADPKSARRVFVRSRRIDVPQQEDWVKLTVPAGLVSSLGGGALTADVASKARVPDKHSGLKFTGAETRIVRTEDGDPQQFVFVQTNLVIDSAEVARHLSLWWRKSGWRGTDGESAWESLKDSATQVALTPVESEAPVTKQHAFRFLEPRTEGSLLVRIEQGTRSPGGFVINMPFEKPLSVPAFPKEVRILGKGNVLALDGERKLAIQSRGIDHLRVSLCRVPVSQFQHLVAMNNWSHFAEPRFDGYFSQKNIIQRWSRIIPVPSNNEWEACASVVDLAEAPPLTTPEQAAGGCGVFFVVLEAVEQDEPASNPDDVYSRIEPPDDEDGWYDDDDGSDGIADGWSTIGAKAERFVMATDLGLLVKLAADGSRDVYVMALGAGQPVAGVEIRALALNGSVFETATTDAAGHASLKPFTVTTGERKPVAIVAAKGSDVSFLPLGERQLPAMDYSRFDIDGVLASRIKAVEAFVFTERGVYRPGDTVHAACIIRRRDWEPVLEGLPVALTLTDVRGRVVTTEKTRLPFDGFVACDFITSEAAALGVYRISADVLDRKGDKSIHLGHSAVRVEEFQPDRMKVSAAITPAPPAGWLPCQPAEAAVTVQSLFGEAAPERRVTMSVALSPADFGFAEWPGYSFYLREETADDEEDEHSRAGRTIDLGETKTDAQGKATFKLPFETLKNATFRAAILTEAFEREGGRSVRHATTCLVSPHESVIGWKADGNLGYLAKDAPLALSFVAIGRDLKPLAVTGLRLRLVEIRQVSVLTRLDNGNYAYVSTRKERRAAEDPFLLPAEVTTYQLPTGGAGDFRLELVADDGGVRCAVPFTVVGKAGGGDTEREAELTLKLAKADILPGAEIEIHLAAPYAGAGLVTLERDRVIAAQWFKTDTKETTLKLKVPQDAEGTYYVNAAFVRSTSAPEVFHSPLSYAAAPLRVLAPLRTLTYELEAPKEVRPGSEAVFAITATRPTRLALYAVDEGIHQITTYKLPRPLDFFLRKQALEVRTQQWLDLLLPEYRFLKAAPAFGGDGDAALSLHLNPFKRRREAPVVFWSGIIDAGPQRTEVKWRVPDYFNGNLRVMAVGCNASAIGTAETSTLVKAPIILVPNTPVFVAPGDEFETSLTVFSNLTETGAVPIGLTLEPSAHLAVVGSSTATLTMAGGTETTARFRLRATGMLGSAELKFTASGGGETVHRGTTMSVRPASHHLTQVTTGWYRTAATEQKLTRQLRPEFRHAEAVTSPTPFGLARGLEAYVNEYPYGCSEQITSRAMTKLVAATEADFGLPPEQAAAAIKQAISLLTSRQRADGGFGYWYLDEDREFEFHSLYVLHFLSEAKSLGHAVPEPLLKGALNYASRTARAEVATLEQAELQAYAIYLLARNGTNPAPQLLNLRDTLDARLKGQWESRTLAAWLAASYQMLKKDAEAGKLLDACLKARAGKPAAADLWSYYRTPMMEDISLFYVQCRHFPERAGRFGIEDLEPVMKPLRDQGFNTLACSYLTLALKAYSDLAKSTGLEVSIAALGAGADAKPLAGPGSGIVRAAFPEGTSALRFLRKQQGGGDLGAFFQITEQGYDVTPPTAAARSGLEIHRSLAPVAKDRPLRPGDPVEVLLRLRNVSGRNLDTLAVVDLMPAGFEVLGGDLKSGAGTTAGADFTELREDRTLFFLGLAANGEWTVKYRIKAVCPGSFTIPAALAEDMYDRGIHATCEPGTIRVEPAE
jgi:uncharacterized protein YfaS (alpha-2-macroglobulin family)